MKQFITHVAIVVHDYDEAINFYTDKLGFRLIEDTRLDENKRWVVVSPQGAKECSILLAKASQARQSEAVGNQTGGRVGFFLVTDDIYRDVENMKKQNIRFERLPSEQPYGIVAVFADLYGNLWDLIQPSERNKSIL